MLPEDIYTAAAAEAATESQKWFGDPGYSRIKTAIDSVTKAIAQAVEKAAPTKADTTLLDLGLESEYAVGKGLISRDELTNFRNTYLAQSQLSLGLIPPMLFVFFALLVDTKNLPDYWPALLVIAVISAFLFFMAVERRHKYRTELKLLLLGHLQKQLEADQAAKEAKKNATTKPATTATDPVRKAIQEELKKLQLEVKPLVVELHATPETKKPDKPTSSSGQDTVTTT